MECMLGYWNLLHHPDMHSIPVFELDDDLYYFRAMALSFAPVCWVCTLLTQEYRPLQAEGWDLAYLLAAARVEGAARFMERLLVRLLTMLGFALGSKKCQLRPIQKAKLVSFGVDSQRQASMSRRTRCET